MLHPLTLTRMLVFGVAVMVGGYAARDAFSEPSSQCPAAVDDAQLHLNYEQFDAAGWRGLLARGCANEAVALLQAYRSAAGARLTEEQRLELPFHIGQALAFSGRDDESIQFFEQARGGQEEWAAYVDATLAFLRKDWGALAAERTRYAHAPHADDMRLRIIDGFTNCAGQPYEQAAMCGMAPHNVGASG